MTSKEEEHIQTPKELLLALKAEMNYIKAEEKSMREQLVSFNEQFKLLVKSAAEIYPEILDEEFPQNIATRSKLPATPNKNSDGATNEIASISGTPGRGSRIPTYTRVSKRTGESSHRILSLDPQGFPRRFARKNSEETEAMIREQFQKNVNCDPGIDARKIRASLPNSPTSETEPGSHQQTPDKERKKN
ncbi:uncharacterized protein [Montipora foliosa]|uniref:uncharacterized protein n=1 Tax=Montipora foliosa TaxID=591990 RepID=UPI0035F16E75